MGLGSTDPLMQTEAITGILTQIIQMFEPFSHRMAYLSKTWVLATPSLMGKKNKAKNPHQLIWIAALHNAFEAFS